MKFVLKEGIEEPVYSTPEAYTSGFDVKAHQILKAFKGDTEITGSKLQKMKDGFNERGYIKLRPFERILFDVGFTIDNTETEDTMDIKLLVQNNMELAITKGLVTAPGIININSKEESLGAMLYNSTPFLNKVEKNENIAKFMIVYIPIAKSIW